MRNLLNSSQIPTIFLDNELRLKRFTALAPRIARLIPGDIGRPITDIAWNLQYKTLARDVKGVLDSLVFKEAEVAAVDGSLYTMRIHPYRTIDDVIDGVVITFVDITMHHRAALRATLEERQTVLERTVGRWPGVAYVEEVSSGRSVVVSARTEEILGYPSAVLANATEGFWRKVREQGRRKAEVRLRRLDGERIRYRESTEVLARSSDGRATHVLHIFRRRADTAKGAHGGGKKAAATRKR